MGRTGAINSKLHVLLHFVMFWCIWDHFVCALNSMQMGQSGAINAKDRDANSRQIFSQRTHPIHHGTQNSSFVAFRNVWVHLGPFCYCTKLSGKWAELVKLMQRFMSRIRIGTFRYERTQYRPWDPKLMFFCIS